jgi:SOS-response transcriptional repressor LexA
MDKIVSIHERLRQLVEAKAGGKNTVFADKLGVNEANVRGYTKNVVPKADILERIVTTYDVNARWLLTGEGRMTIDPSVTVATTTGEGEGIPLIPFDAMAGVFRGEMSAMTSMCEKLYIPGLKADFVIQVSGNSMEPRYYSGDMVACQNISLGDIFFQWGRAYVVDTDQGVLLKRVKQGSSEQTIMLVSENPDYSPFEILRSSIHHIAMVKALVRIE